VNVDLRCRKTNARRSVHSFSHVTDELLDLGCHGRDGRRNLAQSRIRIFEDGEQGHGGSV
jgi:hypothetical protein